MNDSMENRARQALQGVLDPHFSRDIVSLGYVRDLEASEDHVSGTLQLPSPLHPAADAIADLAQQALQETGFAKVSLERAWHVGMAPPAAGQTLPGIRNVVAVASGKGGVGKSTVCINLALSLAQAGARVGLLDCDLYGPSVPYMIGIHERARTDRNRRILPLSVYGMKVMTMGFFVDPGQPLSWRGPMLHKMLLQFFHTVNWGGLDYLFLDLPPGTGDVQLTLTKEAPLSGAVLVTTPQEVALRDVDKGLAMFQKSEVALLGLIENMAYVDCAGCDKRHYPFGRGGGASTAEHHDMPLLGQLPLTPQIPSATGEGEPLMVREPESAAAGALRNAAAEVSMALARRWLIPGASGVSAMEV